MIETCFRLADLRPFKDEQKRIEDSEKASREEMGDRADAIFWELDETINRAENPSSHQQNFELDELSVPPNSSMCQVHDADNSFPRFRQKFKFFVEQYELRELHMHSMMRSKDSEVQVNLAKAEEQRKRADGELAKSRTLNAQVSTFSQTETELRSQLNIYVEKFKQVCRDRFFCATPKSCIYSLKHALIPGQGRICLVTSNQPDSV